MFEVVHLFYLSLRYEINTLLCEANLQFVVLWSHNSSNCWVTFRCFVFLVPIRCQHIVWAKKRRRSRLYKKPPSYVANAPVERCKHLFSSWHLSLPDHLTVLQNTLQKPSKMFTLRLGDVESVKVHYLVPCHYKVVHEFFRGILTSVDFHQSLSWEFEPKMRSTRVRSTWVRPLRDHDPSLTLGEALPLAAFLRDRPEVEPSQYANAKPEENWRYYSNMWSQHRMSGMRTRYWSNTLWID